MFSEAESQFSLPTSGYLGALLCDRWRLPDQARRGCEFHTLEDLLSADENSLPSAFQRMICLGNLIAVLSKNQLSKATREQIADALRTDLNCKEEEFLTLMGDIYELKTEVEGFVGQFN